jgi:hypothetical protein
MALATVGSPATSPALARMAGVAELPASLQPRAVIGGWKFVIENTFQSRDYFFLKT